VLQFFEGMDEPKHGTKQRKVWLKLQLAINEDGEISRKTLTTNYESDVSQVADFLMHIVSVHSSRERFQSPQKPSLSHVVENEK